MAAYYNEHDPKAAAWLRELIRRDLIAPGDVDERSITDVRPEDLAGYRQCHFFAGIGVWSYALRRAGWDDARPVWTGSCPCQPFSAAGKGDGYADERHLWPHWYRLISECRPPTIFGEQVAAAIRTGWLDDVCLSLESCGYAVGAFDFPACSVGAPHIRQRIYFVAESERGTAERHRHQLGCSARGSEGEGDQRQRVRPDARNGGESVAVADADETGCSLERIGWLSENGDTQPRRDADGCSIMGDAELPAGARQRRFGGPVVSVEDAEGFGLSGPLNGFWADGSWIACRDGKARAVEPGTFPLVDRAPARVVCRCSDCETESVIYEGMFFLWEVGARHQGCVTQEVLQRRVLSARQAIKDASGQERAPSQSAVDESAELRAMREHAPASCPPQGPPASEQRTGQSGNALLGVSSQGAFDRIAFDVRRLWGEIQSGVTPEPQQDLLCLVCERVGSHQCNQEAGPSRIVRLRGYGNAIVGPQAEAFIRAYLATHNAAARTEGTR